MSEMFGLVMLALAAQEPTAAEQAPAEPTSAQKAAAENPRVALAGALMAGPHAVGNQDCRVSEANCQTRGGFFGLGTSLEVRVRLASVFSLHVRPWLVGNVAPDKLFGGALGGGIGFGAYGRRVFGRVEYIALHAFGNDRFTPPFFEGAVARGEWGNHAAMIAAGFRKSVHERLRIEAWGGPMFGPYAKRHYPDGEDDRQTLVTFMVGLGVSFDVLPGPW